MPIQTNKNIIITPGRSGFTTSISQIDFKWSGVGVGTYAFERNVYDLRSTIYNWVLDEEPVLLFGGMGTVLGQQYFSGPFPDYVGDFTGITTFPSIKIYPVSGQIYTKNLYVSGVTSNSSISLSSSLFDIYGSSGSPNQILSSVGLGVAWTTPANTGIVTGLGLIDQVTLWNGPKSISGDPSFVYKSSKLGIGTIAPITKLHLSGSALISSTDGRLAVNIPALHLDYSGTSGLSSLGAGRISAANWGTEYKSLEFEANKFFFLVGDAEFLNVSAISFSGFGTSITQLNASNLSQGTVPTNRVSGNYSGITSIGSLSQLSVFGLTTSLGYFGFGTFINQLDASNLSQGTVSSARISGTYSGITSVGSLSQLNVLGLTTSLGYFGFGTFVTQLNASNLSQGTVPSSRVSGDYIGITSLGTQSQISVLGPSYLNSVKLSTLNDSNNSPGLLNQLLSSNGVNVFWTSITAVGVITGIGLANSVPKFSSSTSVTNSNISDDGSIVNINSNTNINGITTSVSYFGFGTFITQLNANSLAQGTVSSARISGDYTGITSVGSLSQLNVVGLTTSLGYFGFGTFVTQLNATNLSQGTVPTARISGDYTGITSVGSLSQLNVVGLTTSLGYFGFGTFVTQLNATNLSQGAVPTARISGDYNGITSVGSLSQLNVVGLTTSLGYFGFGTAITQLNASNLSQGTVPFSRISGDYSGITSVGSLSQLNVVGLTTSLGYFGFGTAIIQLNAANLSQGTISSARISGDYIGITSVGTQSQLSVSGNSYLNSVKLSSINDINNSPGTLNQLLSSNGINAVWTSITAVGVITGLGLANSVAKFLSPSSVTNSNISDNGIIININSDVNIDGITTSISYFGFGTFINELNADNLSQGTVSPNRISGDYTGITAVGSLSQLNIIGLTTSFGYFGFGTSIAELNANNLSQGIVTSARLSGNYTGITSVGSLSQLSVTGLTTSRGYFGFGTGITQLNATNLSQGTVPTARVSGSYASITAVGTLTQLNVTGLTTARGFFGFGTAITQLNATNLTQGIVTSARLSGIYTGITSVGTQSQLIVSGNSYLGAINASANALINSVTVGLGSQNLSSNTVVGNTAFANNISGASNVAIGNFAGQYMSSASQSVAVGCNALVGSISTPVTGNNNTAVGYNALAAVTTGASNNAFGYNAMGSIQGGVVNCAFGANSLASNVTGDSNAAFGNNALNLATSSQNTAVGYLAGSILSSGGDLVAVGYSAARYATTGSGNVAVGSAALVGADAARVSGSYNIGIGYYAGSACSAGAFNTYFGFYSGGLPNGSYQIAIGREVVVTTDNAGCWGANVNSQRTDLGVGVYTPLARVHINTLSAGNKGLIIDGATSQTANLLEINSSIGTSYMKVGPTGQWGFGTAVAGSSGWSASTASPSKSIADGATLAEVINYLATLAEELRIHGIINS